MKKPPKQKTKKYKSKWGQHHQEGRNGKKGET